MSQSTVELVKGFFANDIAKHAELYMNSANIPGEKQDVFGCVFVFCCVLGDPLATTATDSYLNANHILKAAIAITPQLIICLAELPKAHVVSSWSAGNKLKVGFMTSDFRKHPMAYLFINMFRFGRGGRGGVV